MKLAESLRPSRWFSKDRRGVALVTVLTVMALTTILVLTFFSLATSEHRASNTYSHGLQAQQVAEEAVNLVIAQIREATLQTSSPVAWASQPGAIRQWNSNGGDGNAYKLYSDDVMKTDKWSEFLTDFNALKSWSDRPDVYVDLNEPVIRGEKAYFPIVHPKAMTEPQWPRALGEDSGGIEGFRYNADGHVLDDQGAIGRLGAEVEQIPEGHVAMPVMWIYQLADGTLGTLRGSGSGSGSYQFVPLDMGTNSKASAKNPMVARFAFWADDETAKLNMNVHAGGLAWDTPKAGGALDMAMGKYQPAQHEWQRYPGHPATVHLSPALAPGVLDIVNDRDAMEMLYEVVPRIVGGGSESGTRLIDTRSPKEANGLVADREPLFPSLDDVIMRSDREPHEFPNPEGDPIPEEQLSDYLERSKFFVTVSSRAPETNIFGKPRIAMWPIYNAKPEEYQTHLTAFDKLIHYCASLGKVAGAAQYPRYEYIFKRENADSSTYDYEKIIRNKELFAYIRNLLTQPIPGYGVSFADKYEKETGGKQKESVDQLLALIFDYIRTTNLHDDTLFSDFQQAFQKDNQSEHVTYTNPRDLNVPGFGHKGHGQVTPIRIKADNDSEEVRGLGRFYTMSGADIIVTCLAQTEPQGPAQGGYGLYPGVRAYSGGSEPEQGVLYSNLPPLPPQAETDESKQPNWLKNIKGTPEYQAALDPAQWNWQLAFLDPGYRDAVLSNPGGAKYKRELITTASCENMRLQPGEKLVQAAFTFNMFCPSIGWGSINPDMEVHISREGSGMGFKGLDGTFGFLAFEDDQKYKETDGLPRGFVWATNWTKPTRQGGARSYGGLLSFGYTMSAREGLQDVGQAAQAKNLWYHMARDKTILNGSIRSRLTPMDIGYNQIETGLRNIKGRKLGNPVDKVAQAYKYDLVTLPFKVKDRVSFEGGNVLFKVYNGGEFTEASANQKDSSTELIQEVHMNFPFFDLQAPILPPGFPGYINEFTKLSHDSSNAVELASLTADPGNPTPTTVSKAALRSGVGRSTPASASMRGRMALLVNHWDSGETYIRHNDIVQSVCLSHGDARLAAALSVITPDDEIFEPHRKYGKEQMAHSLTNSAGISLSGYDTGDPKNDDYLLVPGLKTKSDKPYRNSAVPLSMGGGPDGGKKTQVVQLYGDFDNGAGLMIDGPYINKPDEGNVHALKTKFFQGVEDLWESQRNYGDFPYFSHPDIAEAGGPAYYSPNRIVSGPGMFGSLPRSLKSSPPRPWETLLFRPDVSGNGYAEHPGAKSPPDHLIMDLFWMPVVEPYAISEPLSTAGKVNLNYEILPFLHIHRDTALRGVFRSEFMLCVPNQWHHSYKHDHGRGKGYHWRDRPFGGAIQNIRLRSAIVEDDTLVQFSKIKFKDGAGAFKTSTEICDIHLIPIQVSERLQSQKGDIGTYTPKVNKSDGTVPDMANGKYWRQHALVGDNSRERPYTNIQTRVTTRSNTFQVHYRAQVIKQSRRDSDSQYGEWRPEVDTVQAEYRGSSVIERYVDPNGKLEDFAVLNADPVDKYYRFRVINPRRFAP